MNMINDIVKMNLSLKETEKTHAEKELLEQKAQEKELELKLAK